MLESLRIMQLELPWFFLLVAFVFGACWGSFLNVVIYRLPAEKSIVHPGSRCMACGTPIHWYHNLPMISWIMLRGKAACCGAPFSVRYPMVECLTAVLFCLSWWLLPPGQALIGWVFISLLVAGTFIDLDHMILPDAFTTWGAVAGILLAFAFPGMHGVFGAELPWLDHLRSGMTAIIGALIGSAVILWIAVLAETLLKKEAMGFGDVLFMGCIGAFCGWQGALFAIFGGALFGTVFVLPLMLLQRLTGKTLFNPGKIEKIPNQADAKAKDQTPDPAPLPVDATAEDDAQLGLGVAIPFGPWLALGGLVYYLFLRDPVDAYFAEMTMLFTGGI